ncbi:MAG: 4Fe-4S binding protein [Chloroflexi bacterium]|nr:4Fe-4S binding protein [Chloroflexota bacterium]
MKGFRYIPNVSTLELDAERCNGCKMCETVCPHGVLAVENRKACVVDLDACMECGACALNCQSEALSVRPGVGCASAVISSWFRKNGEAAGGCGC